MSKLMKVAGAALLMGIYGGAAAQAEGEFSGNVALTSDYVWRGVTQNNEEMAIQGGFDYANGLFYAGTWASTAAVGGANTELDFYAGLAGEMESGLGWDVGVIHYAYPGADDLDFTEVYGSLGYEFAAGVSVGGIVYYDFDNELTNVEGSLGYGFTDNFSVDATVGNYGGDDGDYTHYNIGATFSIPDYVDIDLRFWSNNLNDELGTDLDTLDDRVAITFSRSL